MVDSSSPPHSWRIKNYCDQWGAEHSTAPPVGIYGAMRAGLALTHNDEYVWFLNSGDVLATRASVSAVTSAISSKALQPAVWFVGKTIALDRFLGHKLKFAGSSTEFAEKLKRGSIGLPHSSTVVSARALRDIGAFDKRGIAEDYRIALLLLRSGHTPALIDAPLSVFDETGVSAKHPLRTVLSKTLARVQNQSVFATLALEPVRFMRTGLRAMLRTYWQFTGDERALRRLGWHSLSGGRASRAHFCPGANDDVWPGCCLSFLASEQPEGT